MARGYRGGDAVAGASARIADVPIAELRGFASSKDDAMREAVARRPDAPFAVLLALVQDRKEDVRIAAAEHPRTAETDSLRDLVLADSQVRVVAALVRNPMLDVAVVRRLADHQAPEVREAVWRRLDPASYQVTYGGARHRGLDAPADDAPAEEATQVAARPTRTAPVRGFRPPVDDDSANG